MTTAGQANDVYSDLAAEQDQLEAILAGLGPAQWDRPSAAAGWSVCDVVLHLAQTEELVVATAAGEPFALAPGPGSGSTDERAGLAVAAERGTPADRVFNRWRTARRAALEALLGCQPGARLRWVAAPLSPKTLATTRIAEHWAHALDITGPLGIPYPDTARLRHIAWLAVRTLPYALAQAGYQAGAVRGELTGPDGGTWRFGPDDAPSAVTGQAGEFCRVAARRLPSDQTGLTATGPDGAAALRVVRTYAV